MIKKSTLLLLFIVLNLKASCLNSPIPELSRQINLLLHGGKDLLQVIPNPGNGIFTVIFRSDKKGQIMLAVSDATGKYVYLKTIRDFDGDLKETVDLSGNPKGIYIFEAESDNNRESKKVIYQ